MTVRATLVVPRCFGGSGLRNGDNCSGVRIPRSSSEGGCISLTFSSLDCTFKPRSQTFHFATPLVKPRIRRTRSANILTMRKKLSRQLSSVSHKIAISTRSNGRVCRRHSRRVDSPDRNRSTFKRRHRREQTVKTDEPSRTVPTSQLSKSGRKFRRL
jgi:hypothetical protein